MQTLQTSRTGLFPPSGKRGKGQNSDLLPQLFSCYYTGLENAKTQAVVRIVKRVKVDGKCSTKEDIVFCVFVQEMLLDVYRNHLFLLDAFKEQLSPSPQIIYCTGFSFIPGFWIHPWTKEMFLFNIPSEYFICTMALSYYLSIHFFIEYSCIAPIDASSRRCVVS